MLIAPTRDTRAVPTLPMLGTLQFMQGKSRQSAAPGTLGSGGSMHTSDINRHLHLPNTEEVCVLVRARVVCVHACIEVK